MMTAEVHLITEDKRKTRKLREKDAMTILYEERYPGLPNIGSRARPCTEYLRTRVHLTLH